MTFRQWLRRKVRPDSPHAAIARMCIGDLEFDPQSYSAMLIHLVENNACDHNILLALDAWRDYERSGHAPPESERDRQAKQELEPYITRARLQRMNCVYAGVRGRAGVESISRRVQGARDRELGDLVQSALRLTRGRGLLRAAYGPSGLGGQVSVFCGDDLVRIAAGIN